jgi:hypothetical protein
VEWGSSAARLVGDSTSRDSTRVLVHLGIHLGKEKGCLGRRLGTTVTESSLARGAKQKVSATRFGWSASMRLYALACLRAIASTGWFGARAPR